MLGPGVHTVSVAVTTTTDGLPWELAGGLPGPEGLVGELAGRLAGGLTGEVSDAVGEDAAGVLDCTEEIAEVAHWSAERVIWTQPVTSLGEGLV